MNEERYIANITEKLKGKKIVSVVSELPLQDVANNAKFLEMNSEVNISVIYINLDDKSRIKIWTTEYTDIDIEEIGDY